MLLFQNGERVTQTQGSPTLRRSALEHSSSSSVVRCAGALEMTCGSNGLPCFWTSGRKVQLNVYSPLCSAVQSNVNTLPRICRFRAFPQRNNVEVSRSFLGLYGDYSNAALLLPHLLLLTAVQLTQRLPHFYIVFFLA